MAHIDIHRSRDAALIISATHNPVPLLKQVAEKHGDKFSIRYLDEGPERWRVLLRRVG